jgi:5-formaminoimidazole-4-carboxamide-1-beta-D-ribofuranosyl 5'-monophosphate synthetase
MPLSLRDVRSVLEGYPKLPVVATVGSHSALDIADGAATEGFPTLVLAQAGTRRTPGTFVPSAVPTGAGTGGVWTRSGRTLAFPTS